ncbi:hypothetical protein J4217_00525 [Candidatus Pacearchaeota archaeon]|nr:hypothetical protein [Candidatus Pacearchaeota archaeon]
MNINSDLIDMLYFLLENSPNKREIDNVNVSGMTVRLDIEGPISADDRLVPAGTLEIIYYKQKHIARNSIGVKEFGKAYRVFEALELLPNEKTSEITLERQLKNGKKENYYIDTFEKGDWKDMIAKECEKRGYIFLR